MLKNDPVTPAEGPLEGKRIAMGLFDRKKEAVKPPVSDKVWFERAQKRYDQTWQDNLGSPETFEDEALRRFRAGDVGTSLLFFQKAIELLHHRYVAKGMDKRSPSTIDLPILNGFVDALTATRLAHPEAPVDEVVEQTKLKLEAIVNACREGKLDAGLYTDAIRRIERSHPNQDEWV